MPSNVSRAFWYFILRLSVLIGRRTCRVIQRPLPSILRQNPMEIKITKETDVRSTNLSPFLPFFLGSRRLASLDDEFLPEGMPKETNERTREATVRTYVHPYSVGLGVPFRCQFPWQITALPLFGITWGIVTAGYACASVKQDYKTLAPSL